MEWAIHIFRLEIPIQPTLDRFEIHCMKDIMIRLGTRFTDHFKIAARIDDENLISQLIRVHHSLAILHDEPRKGNLGRAAAKAGLAPTGGAVSRPMVAA